MPLPEASGKSFRQRHRSARGAHGSVKSVQIWPLDPPLSFHLPVSCPPPCPLSLSPVCCPPPNRRRRTCARRRLPAPAHANDSLRAPQPPSLLSLRRPPLLPWSSSSGGGGQRVRRRRAACEAAAGSPAAAEASSSSLSPLFSPLLPPCSSSGVRVAAAGEGVARSGGAGRSSGSRSRRREREQQQHPPALFGGGRTRRRIATSSAGLVQQERSGQRPPQRSANWPSAKALPKATKKVLQQRAICWYMFIPGLFAEGHAKRPPTNPLPKVVLDEAAFLVDVATVDGNWDDMVDRGAECYREVGIHDIAKFVAYRE